MEAILDIVWEYIAAAINGAGDFLFFLLTPLHILGPAMLIAFLALATVALTKLLNRIIQTTRFQQLEKEYHHWMEIRVEALKHSDGEKGRRLARNIDQAELNRAYYDYFFEGLLLNIARKIIPIFFMFAFINVYYRPQNLLAIFGREHIIQIERQGIGDTIIGAPFFYLCSLVICYIAWSTIESLTNGRRIRGKKPQCCSETV